MRVIISLDSNIPSGSQREPLRKESLGDRSVTFADQNIGAEQTKVATEGEVTNVLPPIIPSGESDHIHCFTLETNRREDEIWNMSVVDRNMAIMQTFIEAVGIIQGKSDHFQDLGSLA